MPNFLHLSNGSSVDLDTAEGQYRYLAFHLIQAGVGSDHLAALTNLFRTAEDQKKKADELELKLAAVGEMAVASWNDEAVGICDSAVPDPIRFKDQLRTLFTTQPQRIAQLQKETEELRKENSRLEEALLLSDLSI